MKKNTKEDIQVWTAVGMLFAGVGLSVAGFVVEPLGQIHDSVLWFFAQCLIYAGSIFGIGIYVNGKFNSLVDRLNNNKEVRVMNHINKISALASKLLSKIGIDGMAHIIVCQNLVMWLSKYTPLWLAIIITVVIFVLKEVYDKYCKKTEFSIKDIICDCVGLALGVLTLIL